MPFSRGFQISTLPPGVLLLEISSNIYLTFSFKSPWERFHSCLLEYWWWFRWLIKRIWIDFSLGNDDSFQLDNDNIGFWGTGQDTDLLWIMNMAGIDSQCSYRISSDPAQRKAQRLELEYRQTRWTTIVTVMDQELFARSSQSPLFNSVQSLIAPVPVDKIKLSIVFSLELCLMNSLKLYYSPSRRQLFQWVICLPKLLDGVICSQFRHHISMWMGFLRCTLKNRNAWMHFAY